MNWLNYNGKLLPEDKPIIGANSRGLRFGDGLFETMKSINGRILLANAHFERLWKGMDALLFKVPVHFTPQQLQLQINKLLEKNGHTNSCRIRLTVFRRDGGLYDEIDHTPSYIIQSWQLAGHAGEWNSNGLVLGVYEGMKKNHDAFSGLKHNNFLPYVMAALHAKQQKWNDAILLNTPGRICDSSIANIFLIKDGKVYTPSLEEACIAGIMRKAIIEHLAENNDPVIEKGISVDELMNADEVFLSNSIYNIRWVQSIGDKKYGNSQAQKIYSGILPLIS